MEHKLSYTFSNTHVSILPNNHKKQYKIQYKYIICKKFGNISILANILNNSKHDTQEYIFYENVLFIKHRKLITIVSMQGYTRSISQHQYI